jgi:lipid-binding SYLF domain-containing protein
MRNSPGVLLILAAAIVPAAASHNPDAERLRDASAVLAAAAQRPSVAPMLAKAECIGVFPGVTDGEPAAGGDFGRGVVMCRKSDGTMGAPAFFMISGGIAGAPQRPHSDLVLIATNGEGARRLTQTRVSLEGTTPQAPFHAWSGAEGSFQDVSLEGSVLEPDAESTSTFYGSPVAAKDILQNERMVAPKATQPLVRLTSQIAKRG